MYFSSWSDFIHMGGYGFYVWLSYAICLICILLLFVQSRQARLKIFAEIRRQQQREQRLQQAQIRENQL